MIPVTNPDYEGQNFFEQMRDCREPYRRLAQGIEHVCSPFSTVLDVGCGVGHAIKYLTEQGHDCVGWDGDPQSRDFSECPELIHVVDLRLPLPFAHLAQADLVICTETAEHVEERYADVVVKTVADATSRLLVWSAAQPGQEWPGHVNLQRPTYWATRFATHGIEIDEGTTARLHEAISTTHAQHEYAVTNFMVMRRPR